MSSIKLEIPDYDNTKGITYSWENEFEISTKYGDNIFTISANKAGLISLAKQLITLAESPEEVEVHLHYDDLNSLEDGSIEFVVERI